MKKVSKLKLIVIAFLVLCVIGAIASKHTVKNSSEDLSTAAPTAINNENPKSENKIDDFDYEINGDTVILNRYYGDDSILEIKTSYEIDGVTYSTDISDFQVYSNSAKTIIFDEGFSNINNATFNSISVEKYIFQVR